MALLTSNQKAKEEKLTITAPAFNVTKIASALGALGTAALGIAPASLTEDTAVVIASIASATLLLLGIFALVAVDIRTRQRGEEAKLRYAHGDTSDPAVKPAVPHGKFRVMRADSDKEYAVNFATTENGNVKVFATRADDEPLELDFDVLEPSHDA